MTSAAKRIAMWSVPRGLSTAMMYSFAARGDCTVWDAPFYAAYLEYTGVNHPLRDDVLAMHEPDPDVVASICKGPVPGGNTMFYQKHPALHMLAQFDRRWMRSCTNVFLIRHPARVIASYAKKREGTTLDDVGFVQQAELFDEVAGWSGQAPVVIDSDDIRGEPEAMLRKLCMAIEVPFTRKMLHWPAGGNEADGAWAPHWYAAVHRSTGFARAEGPLPKLGGVYADLARQALPYYERLVAYKL